MYREERLIKTYPWIKATPTSRIVNINTPTIKNLRRCHLSLVAGLLTSTSNKWPATILAARRIPSVRGRINLLTSSINTIKGISTLGVPSGTK